ncbi:MAG: tripartite tricarboxylate transporter substrate binding protein [Beijerinckiaceae bacterium]|nr:tripartite tricarboxylate transporter substrate binding protein [Beijerinckiaceae bacterium]
MHKHIMSKAGLALAAFLALTPSAQADWKPTRPIELVVHTGPGAGSDVMGRALIAAIDDAKLSPVRIQIANKVGGGGATAASYLAGKKGDPHVIGLFTSVWITNPLVQQEANVSLRDLTPVGLMVVEPAMFVVRADSPFKTLPEFIEAAKAAPGKLKQSGGSPLARDALVRTVLQAKTGARWAFISFPSGGERISALLGGHVDAMVIEPAEAGELIRSGKIRAVAQIADARLPDFKDIPTLKEAGFDVANPPQSRGVVGPPDMAPDVLKYYEELVSKAAASPGWQKFIRDGLFEGKVLSPKETSAFLAKTENEVREILKEAGVKLVR